MTRMKRAWLYLNTVKNLKPVQIRYQIRDRIFKGRKKKYLYKIKKLKKPKSWKKVKILIPELDCESQYLHRFQIDKLIQGEIELLHESHRIERKWNILSASHLWNYNLHYLEFLIPLIVKYKETGEECYFLIWKKYLEGWLEQMSDDSFEPYPISMRLPNLLICMELLGEKLYSTKLESRIMTSLYQQYRYLIRTQERALLANHYFENLKAIVIFSLLFQEPNVYYKYFNIFLKEIEKQILPEGLHFERSLMYHKIILEDILRVYTVLNNADHAEDAEKLIPVIRIMTSVLSNLEQGFQRTPLFNDAGNNVSKDKRALARVVEKLCSYEEIEASNFEVSGYYKLYQNGITIFFDCGELSPNYMGGHAHCDCLSFELSINGKVLFVNSGTGQYQGELRTFFRSTSAHNTVMIDNREQSEMWGEHRVARRMRKVKGEIRENALIGRFQSYQGDFFRRKIKWKNEKTLVITDDFKVHDTGKHKARQFLHLAPGYQYEQNGKQIKVREGKELKAIVRIPTGCDYLIHTEGTITFYAEDFGKYQKKQVLEIQTLFWDNVQLQIEIEIKTGE